MTKTITVSDETWEQIRSTVEEENKKPRGAIIYKTNGSVLFESTKQTLREAVIEKYELDKDLRWANLRGADLQGADLRRADLRCADLRWANLLGAKLLGVKTAHCIVSFSPSEKKQARQFAKGVDKE